MKIKAMLTISVASLLLAACSSMDTQNKAKVVPVASEVTHTHAENCSYYAVTHTHGPDNNPATHDHGRGCKTK